MKYFIFFLYSDDPKLIPENACSERVFLQLEDEAHALQRELSAKYTMANGLSSGKPYWTNDEGTKAVWFKNYRWTVGEKSDLGTTTGGLKSTNSPPCPESVELNWKYQSGEEWLDAQGNAKMHKYEGMIHRGDKQFINVK